MAQDQDDRPLEELLACSLAEIGVQQSGREMIAAMRRGDRQGAELALIGYLGGVERLELPDPFSVLGSRLSPCASWLSASPASPLRKLNERDRCQSPPASGRPGWLQIFAVGPQPSYEVVHNSDTM